MCRYRKQDRHSFPTAEVRYQPVPHNHKEFIKKALKKKDFNETYEALEEVELECCSIVIPNVTAL